MSQNEIRALFESAAVINQADSLYVFAPFEISVKTDNAGTSGNDEFTLPLKAGETYSCFIDWGDGVTTFQGDAVSPTHTYAAGAGTYTICITGTFPAIYFNNGGDKLKLLDIQQWGDIAWVPMGHAFRGCIIMNITATDTPDLSSVISMTNMFKLCDALDAPMNNWSMGNITDISSLYAGCDIFNQDLSNWDTSNITNISAAFLNCVAFDQDIGSWDVSSLTTANSAFSGATLSTANYDALLVGWNAQSLQSGVNFHGGNSTYTQTSVDSGVTDGTTANHLIDSTQNFDVTVTVGDIVHNTTDDTYAAVTNVLAADLTLDADIMITGENYVIQSSAAAKARYNMLSSDGWTIIDGGPV